MQKIHYHNDFSVTLTLENMRVELIDEVVFYTRPRGSSYSCAYCCGTLNRLNLDTVTCVLDGHSLEPGTLKYKVVFQLPDASYPDGYQQICQHYTTDIELVTGNGDTNIGTAIAVYSGSAECVYEFSKFVVGASFIEEALDSEVGEMVFCNADDDIAGEYYHVFMINTDGTVEGLRIMLPKPNKIYINATNGNCYRWSGSNLVEFSKSMVLGETNTTAYAGSKGKANAEAIAEIQEQIRKYTVDYETQLPTDVPEFTLAKVRYSELKTYSELQDGDYIYRMVFNTSVVPRFAREPVNIMLPNQYRIDMNFNMIQGFSPTNDVWTLYDGRWMNQSVAHYQNEISDNSGIITEINRQVPIYWLKAYTKQDALFIYLSGTWQGITLQ